MTNVIVGKQWRVAVYGTLRNGCVNHPYLADAKYLGTVELQGWKMHSNGSFPYITKSEGSIIAEIYEIDEASLGGIDDLDGYPDHYTRKQVITDFGECWLYYVDKLPWGCFKIPSGDWLKQ